MARSAKTPRKPAKLSAKQERTSGPFFSADLLETLAARGKRTRAQAPDLNPFKVASHPPAATPPKELQMAMDSNIEWANGEWAGGLLGAAFAEGLVFPGYPYLSELALRPEYRTFSDTIATEMTRKWIRLYGRGTKKGEPDAKADKIKELSEYMDNLGVRDAYCTIAAQDGYFGRSHLFHQIGDNDGSTPEGRQELKSPIGYGHDTVSKSKVGKSNPLTKVTPIEAVWTYPTTYNAQNPLRSDWYNPQVWYTMGIEIHATRMPVYISRPVPDLLKPAYSFGGISLSQLAQPYVDIWLQTRESIGRLIHSFSVMVLSTNLVERLGIGDAEIMNRVAGFNLFRDNGGTYVIDKEQEEFGNVSVPLSGLHELQAQAQEHLCSIARIPVAIYTGLTPTGLNASSEGEIRIFENTIAAMQERFFRRPLTRTINFCQLSLWDAIDEDIVFDFVPLRELTELEEAELRKLDAETDDILVNGCMALNPEDVRVRVASDENGPHANLDPDDVPKPPPMMGEGGEGNKINIRGTQPFKGGGKPEQKDRPAH